MAEQMAIERFKQRVDAAMGKVKLILDAEKHDVKIASDVHHRYDDKFALSEFLTNVALVSQLSGLTAAGGAGALSDEQLTALRTWAQTDRTVSLRFRAEEASLSCRCCGRVPLLVPPPGRPHAPSLTHLRPSAPPLRTLRAALSAARSTAPRRARSSLRQSTCPRCRSAVASPPR